MDEQTGIKRQKKGGEEEEDKGEKSTGKKQI